ncbi:MAG: heme o synthase [Bacteroidota bacterium]
MERVGVIRLGPAAKSKAYYELLKPRLSFLVVFSSGFGYVLGNYGNINWVSFIFFLVGGFAVSGSSVIINQILEKDFDAMMGRTKGRPIPTQRVSIRESAIYSFILGVFGVILIFLSSNALAAGLSFLSLLLYAFVYTPLKRVGPIAVFVGALPGALPPLIGWAASHGAITFEALLIFSIQFLWQFPHFWAIAWVADEDYKRAGFRLLPNNGKKDLNTAVNIMVYTLFLLPLGLLPSLFEITGHISAIVTTVCGVLFLAQTFTLMKDTSKQNALRIMFGSFIYLPIVQITFLLDQL